MKISIAQINPTLGAFQSNIEKIIDKTNLAKNDGADLLIFSELSLFGYYPADLIERVDIVKDQLSCLKKNIKKFPKGISVIVGGLNIDKKGFIKNSAFLIKDNKIQKIWSKELLPYYDVFDEQRHIWSGDLSKNIFKFKGKKFLITICEDLWGWKEFGLYESNPLNKVKDKLDGVINLSASPYEISKFRKRKSIASKISKKFKCPLMYVNQVGAQDELIFDGSSFFTNSKGEVQIKLDSFNEDQITFDFIKPVKLIKKKNKNQSLFEALTLGVKDYVQKSGFNKAHLGLSGGVDSALVYILACEALGAENVTPIAMPGPHSSDLSYKLAARLAENMGSEIHKVDINNSYDHVLSAYQKSFGSKEFGVMNENLQARLRALILMGFGNHNPSLLLATSNKSELAVGYSTLYGDQCGALMPIGDLVKNEVFDLCNWYNKHKGNDLIPRKIITRPPTAELRPNQKDSDSLPPYSELDRVVNKIITNKKKASSETERWVLKKVFQNEFKRWQAPPILKVSEHAFGRGRRFPLAHKTSI